MTQTPTQLRHDIAKTIVGLSDRGEISLTLIERILIEYDALKQGEVTHPQQRVLDVCQKYGISAARLRGGERGKELRAPRIELARSLRADGLTYPAIGRIINRDHTTIFYMLKSDFTSPPAAS